MKFARGGVDVNMEINGVSYGNALWGCESVKCVRDIGTSLQVWDEDFSQLNLRNKP